MQGISNCVPDMVAVNEGKMLSGLDGLIHALTLGGRVVNNVYYFFKLIQSMARTPT